MCVCVPVCWWWWLRMQGYGKFLISLAYHLSHLEGKPGTAERPLSDLGAVSFRSYWTRQVLDALKDCKGEVTVQVRADQCGAQVLLSGSIVVS